MTKLISSQGFHVSTMKNLVVKFDNVSIMQISLSIVS